MTSCAYVKRNPARSKRMDLDALRQELSLAEREVMELKRELGVLDQMLAQEKSEHRKSKSVQELQAAKVAKLEGDIKTLSALLKEKGDTDPDAPVVAGFEGEAEAVANPIPTPRTGELSLEDLQSLGFNGAVDHLEARGLEPPDGRWSWARVNAVWDAYLKGE